MISTTLTNPAPVLDLVSAGKPEARARSAARKERPGRNWTLLLVFLVSPLIMIGLSAGILMAMLL